MFDLIILALLCAMAGALFTLIIHQIKALVRFNTKSKLLEKSVLRRAKVAAVAERNRAQIVEDLKNGVL